MIYTSYYANHKKFPKGITVVSISRYVPHYLDIKQMKLLAPSSSLLQKWKRNKINWGTFTDLYFEELLLKIEYLKEKLTKLDKGYYLLLCYEENTGFCHRHLLQTFCDKYIPELNIVFKEL